MSARAPRPARYGDAESAGAPGSDPGVGAAAAGGVPWRAWGAVFALALGLRLAYLFALRGTPLFEHLLGDAPLWRARGAAAAAGDWVGPTHLWQAPGYGWFLGLVELAFGPSGFAARVVQAVLGALTAVGVGELARRTFDRRTGLVSGLLAATYPAAWFFEGQLLRAAPAQLLLVGFLLAGATAATGRARRPARALFLAGLALGLALVVREGLLVLVLPLGALAWRLRRASGTRPAHALLAPLLGLALGLAPGVARDLAAGVAPLTPTTNVGPNLYIGNHEGADGLYRPLRPDRGDPAREEHDAIDLASLEVGRRLDGPEASAWWRGRALDWVTEHPGDALLLTLRKARLVLHAEEWADSESLHVHRDRVPWLDVAARVWNYGLLVALALAGVVLLPGARDELPGAGRPARWLLLCAASVLVSLLPLFVFARYRLPLVPCLLPLAAWAAVTAGRRWRAGRPGSLVPAGLAVLATLGVLHGPSGVDDAPRATHWMNLGMAQLRAGDPEGAQASFDRARALEPGLAGLGLNRGVALFEAGRNEDAVAVLEPLARRGGPLASDAWVVVARARLALGDPGRATLAYEEGVRAGATSPETAHDLAKLAARLGRPDQAEVLFRAALEARPDLAAAHNDLGLLLEGRGEWAEAAREYEAALADDPDLDPALFNLAWLRAVAPDPRERDGARVRELVARGRARHGAEDAECLALEAAASATDRRFEEAARLGADALARARARDEGGLVDMLLPRVQAWQQGRTWTYPAPPPR